MTILVDVTTPKTRTPWKARRENFNAAIDLTTINLKFRQHVENKNANTLPTNDSFFGRDMSLIRMIHSPWGIGENLSFFFPHFSKSFALAPSVLILRRYSQKFTSKLKKLRAASAINCMFSLSVDPACSDMNFSAISCHLRVYLS